MGKMEKVIFFCLIILSAAVSSCKKDNNPVPPPPDDNNIENTIVLSTEWQEMNKIAVKWNSAEKDTNLIYTYRLIRKDPAGNEYSKDFILTSNDTTCIDDNDGNGLTEGTPYGYKIEATYDNTLEDTSSTIYVRTLSPGSHNITWEIDTLGQPGDLGLLDIWGLDENNVWAVGGVSLPGAGTLIIKWNGIEWQYHSWPQQGGINGIFGFSENDIIVVGGGTYGFTARWDGNTWRENAFFPPSVDTIWGLKEVWGSSPDDVWAVGDRGTIIHWDGSQWRKVQSPTNLILYDIWGTSANNIYAVHISFSGQSRLIHYDGSAWREITGQLPPGQRSLTSLWFDKGGTGYLVGNYAVYYDGAVFNGIDINQNASLLRVRGRNSADVFAVGVNGRVYHFNGIDWSTYPELYDDTPGMELRGVFAAGTTVFAVGIINGGAIIYKGVKQ